MQSDKRGVKIDFTLVIQSNFKRWINKRINRIDE